MIEGVSDSLFPALVISVGPSAALGTHKMQPANCITALLQTTSSTFIVGFETVLQVVKGRHIELVQVCWILTQSSTQEENQY